jgi:hypothetical protein
MLPMKMTPRQLVVRGREMAGVLLHALEQDRMIARFIDTYAVEFERPVCTAYAGQYREMLFNIRREALLAMTVWLERELPRILRPPRRAQAPARSRSAKTTRKPAARKQIEMMEEGARIFYGEYQAALAQALGWHPREMEEFRRDLRLYRLLMAGKDLGRVSRKQAAHVEGPFVDRCAVLLDPSMLDKSRVAAAEFQKQLHSATQSLLRKLFSRRREN